jgi:hypothetical protein
MHMVIDRDILVLDGFEQSEGQDVGVEFTNT